MVVSSPERWLAVSLSTFASLRTGAESATRVCGMASEIRSVPKKSNIIHDNHCMFSHFVWNQSLFTIMSGMFAPFVRNQSPFGMNVFWVCFLPRHTASASPACVATDLASMTFALERHHLKKKALFFLQTDHALYTPEVQIELHREWKDLTYLFNESINAWLDNLVSNVRDMCLQTLEMYTPLVADLWNEFIVRPGEVAQLPRHGPRHVALKPL